MNIMGLINANNLKMMVTVVIIVLLLLIIANHFFKDLFKLNPFYRNNILLEGFDGETAAAPSGTTSSEPSGTAPSGTAASEPVATVPVATAPSGTAASEPVAAPLAPVAAAPVATSETDKSTMMADLFEKVNTQMDMIRTVKLSDKFTPINIDKTVSEPFAILMNLKLLINNCVYKNEIDLKEMYDKYIGNKGVQLLVSDINSINMDTASTPDVGSLETTFLTRCKSIVDGHQNIIDKLLENKNKQNNL
jgi:hypothetical protein